MFKFLKVLKYDPIKPLAECNVLPILYFIQKEFPAEKNSFINNKIISKSGISFLPEPEHLLNRQKENGSWEYPGKVKDIRDTENYNQLETFRNIGILIEKYDFNNEDEAIRRAADFLFTFQTKEGDFRGIYGSQYATTYSALISELLIKAGYEDDKRIDRSLLWLLSIRQNDGGWAIPLRTVNANYYDVVHSPELILPDSSRPFSHLITGMALRAFAVSGKYRNLPEIKHAARLLMSRFFKRDSYPDRNTPDYWIKFSYPFWFTDLLTSLDSLAKLGFSKNEPAIQKAIEWFVNVQDKDGIWRLKLLRGKDKHLNLWITLAIIRMFKAFYD